MIGQIKGLTGVLIGSTLGGEAIRAVGNIGSGLSDGMKGATQTIIGAGVLGHAANVTSKFFKFK